MQDTTAVLTRIVSTGREAHMIAQLKTTTYQEVNGGLM
jgi:hypothetical protein